MEVGYYRIIENKLYILKTCLIDNGMNRGTINNEISHARVNKTNFYHTYRQQGSRNIWILYQSIPLRILEKYNFPLNESKFIENIKNATPENNTFNSQLDFILQQVWLNGEYWSKFIPIYRDYFNDIEVISNYARTHAVIIEILNIKKAKIFELKEIHNSFQKLPKVTFKSSNYSYFSNKLKMFQRNGIEETLIHKFKINGRKPYRVDSVVKTLIQSHRLNTKRYSKSLILILVNTHLKHLGYHPISQSTVNRICNDMSFRNKTDVLRLGKKYANDNINSYLSRKAPDHAGGLYMIDSTQINIYYNNDGIPSYLTLCVVMDVYSRKIVGHSIGENENFQLIQNAIKASFVNGRISPDCLLVDNHAAYHSYDFKLLKNKLMSVGTHVRYAEVKNAKDKAHIERWFGTFQSKYLIRIYGFLGEGIKTRKEGGRANDEKTQEYRKKKNLYTKENLVELINQKISNYNEDIHNVIKDSPHNMFRISSKNSNKTINKYDIALLFGSTTVVTVRNEKVKIKVAGIIYTYIFCDTTIADKINRTKVKIHYDAYDLSSVFISDLENKFIGIVYRDKEINIVPLTSEDYKAYQSFNLRNHRKTQQNLKEVYKTLKDGYQELNAIPILGLDEDENLRVKLELEESLNDVEKELISLKVIENTSQKYSDEIKLKMLPKSINKNIPFILKKID